MKRNRRARNVNYGPERVGDILSEIAPDLFREPYDFKKVDFKSTLTEQQKRDVLQRHGLTERLINKPEWNTDMYKDARKNDFEFFAKLVHEEICRKRSERRHSMFSRQVIGKGKGGSQKPRKMSDESKVRC